MTTFGLAAVTSQPKLRICRFILKSATLKRERHVRAMKRLLNGWSASSSLHSQIRSDSSKQSMKKNRSPESHSSNGMQSAQEGDSNLSMRSLTNSSSCRIPTLSKWANSLKKRKQYFKYKTLANDHTSTRIEYIGSQATRWTWICLKQCGWFTVVSIGLEIWVVSWTVSMQFLCFSSALLTTISTGHTWFRISSSRSQKSQMKLKSKEVKLNMEAGHRWSRQACNRRWTICSKGNWMKYSENGSLTTQSWTHSWCSSIISCRRDARLIWSQRGSAAFRRKRCTSYLKRACTIMRLRLTSWRLWETLDITRL